LNCQSVEDSLVTADKIKRFTATNLCHYPGLENQGEDPAKEGADEQRHERFGFADDENDHRNRNKEKPRAYVKRGADVGKRGTFVCKHRGGLRKSEYRKNDERDDHCGNRCVGHISDMREQVGTGHRGGEIGSVRQWRKLVAEVSARNNSTGHHAKGHPDGRSDPDERNAYRSRCGPGTSRRYRNYCTDDQAGREKYRWIEDLQTVIYHGRDNAAHQPCA